MTIDASFFVAMLAGALRLATPLLFVMLGAWIAQRAGLINLGVDGIMSAGASAGIIGASFGGWPMGLCVAMFLGALLGLALAAISVLGRANLIIAGIGVGALATGTADLMAVTWHAHGLLAPVSLVPAIGAQELRQNLLTWVALPLIVTLTVATWYLRAHVVLDAVATDAIAARVRGIAVTRWQCGALALSGLAAGLGGAALTLGFVGSYAQGMTAGRGFAAIALVILARKSVAALAGLAVSFAALESLGLQLQQALPGASIAVLGALPYVAVLVAMALRAPK